MNIITLNFGSDLRFSGVFSGVDLTGYTLDLFDAHPVFDNAATTITDAAAGAFDVVSEWSDEWAKARESGIDIRFRLRLRQGQFDTTTRVITVKIT